MRILCIPIDTGVKKGMGSEVQILTGRRIDSGMYYNVKILSSPIHAQAMESPRIVKLVILI